MGHSIEAQLALPVAAQMVAVRCADACLNPSNHFSVRHNCRACVMRASPMHDCTCRPDKLQCLHPAIGSANV